MRQDGRYDHNDSGEDDLAACHRCSEQCGNYLAFEADGKDAIETSIKKGDEPSWVQKNINLTAFQVMAYIYATF